MISILDKYYYGDERKNGEMIVAGSMHGIDNKLLEG